jgi:O-antigen/teichoic acid export membrane protein
MKLDRKFWDDTVWNYSSLAVVASSGLFINLVIAAQMGSEALGIFNQTYAIYIIAAQIAVMAVHDSTQKHTAEYAHDERARTILSAAGILHAAVTGSLVAFAVYLGSGLLGFLLDSEPTAQSIAYTAPGLALYSVNKVMMGVLNGKRKMRLYAIGQSVRGFGILGVCLFVALNDHPPALLGLSFTVTEAILFPFLLIVAAPKGINWKVEGEMKRWVKEHFAFGSRASINALLADAHIRVNIIILGLFLSDEQVGVYSFASLFIEGLFQIPVVMRTISNPVLVKLLSPIDKEGIGRFVRRISGLSFLMTAATAAVLIVIFPYFDKYFDPDMIEQGYPLLIMLACGMAVFSIFVPTDHALLQAGRPGKQSVMMTSSIALNALLNVSLIPLYGLSGSAFATTVSFLGTGLILNMMAWRYLGLKGGFLIAK